MWFGCDLVQNYLGWYYLSQARSELVCFWCGLVSFGVLWCDFYICCGNRFFMVWFGCDLFLNDMVWYYWHQFRSELVLLLVWFGVSWCGLVWFLHFLVLMDVLLCDLGVIWFWMSWCDIIDVRLGLSSFIFGVIWSLLVWFGVICNFFYW